MVYLIYQVKGEMFMRNLNEILDEMDMEYGFYGNLKMVSEDNNYVYLVLDDMEFKADKTTDKLYQRVVGENDWHYNFTLFQ